MFKNLFSKLMTKPTPDPVEVDKKPQVANDNQNSKVKQQSKPAKVFKDEQAKLASIRAKAQEIVIEAKSESLRIRTEAQDEAKRIKQAVLEDEKRIAVQKVEVETKLKDLDEKTRNLRKARETIENMNSQAEELLKKRKAELERVSGLTKNEAREAILKQVDKDLVVEKSKKIKSMEEELKKTVDQKGRELLVEVMRYGATDYVVEYTSSKVKLPDEDIKGRIIGKEGRNIKKLEEKTGVEFDMDSNSDEILISSFDPTRREIAKVSLERLMKDGRIQPARIEEVVEQVTGEIERIMEKAGEDLCHMIGAYHVPKELVKMLGKYKYRFSYGQNLIEHTLEETKMGIALAHELGIDVETVRLGCLFHDIGKIVTEDEGTHIQLGVDLLNKYGIDEAVVNCVAEHHEDRPFSSIESAVVHLVDHVSGARPGARGEDFDAYVKRMKALENAATQYDGVDKAYAISAGREVRVFVKPERVDDDATAFLAREIAKKIELEQTYPGVVKVTVIRETRVSETAK